MELFGLVVVVISIFLGVLNIGIALLFFGVAIRYGILLSIFSLTIEKFSYHRYHLWSNLASDNCCNSN